MPPSTNHIYGRGSRGVYMFESVRQAKDAIGWEARSQYHGEPLEGPLAVKIDLYWPDRRKHDIDNIKVLLDALTGILWVDDGQIVELSLTKRYDKENPGVMLGFGASRF
ncbi:RusA family crossover junction endodeoxyribonuclease [Qipengyuania sp. RS5-5]|uniref:RusA family crossover junction endodeoxyribonuclease n=2 Tax=Parerythrobacter lacustris TaxID=2969984 RepID=A0ABT1XQC9_9SPHN|nr:RusA family crossover junction endodeoxyribonuclease [Parerythrobacter lacustris]MCR2833459.1 RusA family crossover junction endodeoxyribonuclease [Parerythrobacter lacustris]